MNHDSQRTEAQAQSELRRYVLGNLSEEEQEAFEVRYFADPALLGEMQSLRSELLEDYLAGALEPAEHELIAARLARSTVWRNHTAMLASLRELAHQAPPPPAISGDPAPDMVGLRPVRLASRPWQRWLAIPIPLRWAALGTALLLLGLGIGRLNSGKKETPPLIALAVSPTPYQSLSNPTPTLTPVVNATATPAPANPSANLKARTATFALTLNLTRQSGEAAVLNLKPGTTQLELQLDLGTAPENLPSFQVTLHNDSGRSLWHTPRVLARRQQGRSVLLLSLPASLVPPGSYELRIRNHSSLASSASSATESILPFQIQTP